LDRRGPADGRARKDLTMSSDATNNPSCRDLTRRQMLHSLGAALSAVPLVQLVSCSSDAVAVGAGGGSGAAGGTGDANGAGGASGRGGSASDASEAAAAEGDAGSWATGGTASISGNYADPFTSGLGTTCVLTCAATLGPCYAATLVRKDISEGHDGLPVRLAFLVVDESCRPIQGASIDIWHTAPEGLYSGNDANPFCTLNDATALASRWFRGVQTTDSSGRVDFDTCFPGWYSGRTIHIHFTIRVGDTEYATSQLFFTDELDDEIVATQPLYNTHGSRDTTNQNDSVIAASAVADYTFQTARMADGVMLAWKTIVIRSSLANTLCNVPGGSGGGGPGGDGGPGGPFGDGPFGGRPPGDAGMGAGG
jgi:protocatechuate 3,4-dioxygenase beta subunit